MLVFACTYSNAPESRTSNTVPQLPTDRPANRNLACWSRTMNDRNGLPKVIITAAAQARDSNASGPTSVVVDNVHPPAP